MGSIDEVSCGSAFRAVSDVQIDGEPVPQGTIIEITFYRDGSDQVAFAPYGADYERTVPKAVFESVIPQLTRVQVAAAAEEVVDDEATAQPAEAR